MFEQGSASQSVAGSSLIAMTFAVAFFAVPALKLKETALTVVLLIGVAAMAYNFIETVRERDLD